MTRPADPSCFPPSLRPIRIACVGDSITAGGGTSGDEHTYPAHLARLLGSAYDVRNFGVSGATLLSRGDMPYVRQAAFGEAVAFAPDVLVVKLGTNDSKQPLADEPHVSDNWMHKADFEADYLALLAAFRAVNPAVRIHLCLPVPAFPGRWGIDGGRIRDEIGPLVRRIAATTGARVIDTHSALSGHPDCFPDTVHPNDEGARLLAETVHAALKQFN